MRTQKDVNLLEAVVRAEHRKAKEAGDKIRSMLVGRRVRIEKVWWQKERRLVGRAGTITSAFPDHDRVTLSVAPDRADSGAGSLDPIGVGLDMVTFLVDSEGESA